MLLGASVQNLDMNKRTVPPRFECRKEGWRRLTAISAFMSFFVQLAEEKAKESIRDRIDSLAPFFSAELLQNPACRQFCAEISPRTSTQKKPCNPRTTIRLAAARLLHVIAVKNGRRRRRGDRSVAQIKSRKGERGRGECRLRWWHGVAWR